MSKNIQDGDSSDDAAIEFIDKDEESESDDDAAVIVESPNTDLTLSIANTMAYLHQLSISHKLFEARPLTHYLYTDVQTYNFKTWPEYFPDGVVNLRRLIVNPNWHEFFDQISTKPYYLGIERILSGYLTDTTTKTIVPYAELVFNIFNILSPHQIKVVFMGQDPYIGIRQFDNHTVPQSTGASFSVPLGYPKPPSLRNIEANLLKFGHISEPFKGGCLANWIIQGCFMLNSSLTTFVGTSNVHKTLWQNLTKDLIIYLNETYEKIIFIAWGADAHRLYLNIDPNRHHIITSSHPSPHSFLNTFSGFAYGTTTSKKGKTSTFDDNRDRVTYPPFATVDHFGKINAQLRTDGKPEIYWNLIDATRID